MYSAVHCIALRTTAVADSRSLLNAWSRETGPITLALPAGASREARRRRALTVPLAMFEGAVDIRPGREVLSMRDFMPMAGSVAMAPSNPERAMVCAFLAEVLAVLLRRTGPDEHLSDYLFESVSLAGQGPSLPSPNYHLGFLAAMTRHIGIAPDMSAWSPGCVLDMRDGLIRPSAPLHHDYLNGDEAQTFGQLVRLGPAGAGSVHLDRAQRQRALGNVLHYLSVHLGPLPPLRSLEVLRDMC